MKKLMILFLVGTSTIIFGTCKKASDKPPTERRAMQYFDPDVCCANLYLLDNDVVFVEKTGYESNSLAAVNLETFAERAQLVSGDTVWVTFSFTEQRYECMTACGRLDGTPIEILEIEPY